MPRTRGLQWLVIPIVVLGSLEYAARRTFVSVPQWYGTAEAVAARNHIDFIFVGSSRVAAAVSLHTFETEMRVRTGTQVHAMNLGRGFTTLAEHYLGVRNLLDRYPDNLRGCTVFLEAESGLSWPARWQDAWTTPQQPQLLVPLLRWRDLWRLAQSQSSRDEKVTITTRLFFRWSTLVAHHERIREQILAKGLDSLTRMLAAAPQVFRLTAPPMAAGPAASEPLDLESAGGIRTDSGAFDEVRQLARVAAKTRLENQAPAGSWEESIQADFAALMKAHGAKLVFFQMPESSTFSVGYATDGRQHDRASFEEQVRKWATVLLKPRFSFDDDDFPDLWHLSRPRSVVFTGALVQAWLAERSHLEHFESP